MDRVRRAWLSGGYDDAVSLEEYRRYRKRHQRRVIKAFFCKIARAITRFWL